MGYAGIACMPRAASPRLQLSPNRDGLGATTNTLFGDKDGQPASFDVKMGELLTETKEVLTPIRTIGQVGAVKTFIRQAQADLIRGPEADGRERAESVASAPFHWAAFQLYGDWR